MMDRRNFLTAAASSVAVAVSATGLASLKAPNPEFIAVPREAWEAVEQWAAAHRSAVMVTNAYSDAARSIGLRRRDKGPLAVVSPADQTGCNRLFAEHVRASEAVGPARERMIFALLKATRAA